MNEPRTSRPLRSAAYRAKQGHHHYYEPVRPRATATVLTPSRFIRSRNSLSPPRTAGGSIRARSLPFRTEAADQAHATSTPGTTWPAIRATARLIPDLHPRPGSDATANFNDASHGEPPAHRGFQRNVFLIPT
jgi:hypothetical protein